MVFFFHDDGASPLLAVEEVEVRRALLSRSSEVPEVEGESEWKAYREEDNKPGPRAERLFRVMNGGSPEAPPAETEAPPPAPVRPRECASGDLVDVSTAGGA